MIDEISLPTDIDFFEENEDIEFLSMDKLIEILSTSLISEKIKNDTLVVINDAHRATPSYVILDILSKMKHRITDIIIATGTHNPPSENELENLLKGTEKKLGAKVHIHDCMAEMDYYGITERETEVNLNPIVRKFKHILVINSVEPHYFAGWTGGVKSLIPGLAAKSTVAKNHAWALHENSGPNLVDNNPLQLDLWEGFSFIEEQGIEVSAIQIINQGKDIIGITHGGLHDAFKEAILIAEKIYVNKISEQYDVIVSFVQKPLDRSLYQAQKGIENTRQALKKGGTMVLVAECPEGIGNTTFFNTISAYSDPHKVIEALSLEKYNFGDHKAVKFASIARDNELFIISEGISISDTRKVFAKNISMLDLEDLLMKKSNEGKSIAIVMNGAMITLTME